MTVKSQGRVRLEAVILGGMGILFVGAALWGLTPPVRESLRPLPAPLPVWSPKLEQADGGVPGLEPDVHPLAELSDAEVARRVVVDLASLGSLSVGQAFRGALFNPVGMPDGPYWQIVDPSRSYGTQETVEALVKAITAVNTQFPDSQRLFIGHLSKPKGGYISPHRSHQSGCDVDLGYYYTTKPKWYQRATAQNLDVPRTWALVKALLTQSEVEFIFMDKSIEELLVLHARWQGEDAEWLEQIFRGTPGALDSVVRHRWGHATHFHVRFLCATSRESGWRAYPALLQKRLLLRSGYYGRGATGWR